MKKLLYILAITLLTSCTQYEYVATVTFDNGEEATVKGVADHRGNLGLDEGDLYLCGGGCNVLASGVRTFEFVSKTEIRD